MLVEIAAPWGPYCGISKKLQMMLINTDKAVAFKTIPELLEDNKMKEEGPVKVFIR